MLWLSLWIVTVVVNLLLVVHHVTRRRRALIQTRGDILFVVAYSFIPVINIIVLVLLLDELPVDSGRSAKFFDRVNNWLYEKLP